jgi:uncharacterized membrane-anchored protein
VNSQKAEQHVFAEMLKRIEADKAEGTLARKYFFKTPKS